MITNAMENVDDPSDPRVLVLNLQLVERQFGLRQGALPVIVNSLKPGTGGLGKLITIGTPFLDTRSNLRRKNRTRRWLLAGPVLVVWLLVAYLNFAFLQRNWQGFYTDKGEISWNKIIVAALAFSTVALLLIWSAFQSFQGWHKWRRMDLPWQSLGTFDLWPRALLVLSSRVDEACQILYHLVRAENPLAPRVGLLAHLRAFRSHYLLQQASIRRLRGVQRFRDANVHIKAGVIFCFFFLWSLVVLSRSGSGEFQSDTVKLAYFFLPVVLLVALAQGEQFASALLSPLMALRHQIGVYLLLPNEVTTYIVRKRAWAVFQRTGLGLDSYPAGLPPVSREPGFLPRALFQYEELPGTIEERALRKRDSGLGQHVGTIAWLLAKDDVTAGDISALLQSLEEDISLVHAAYYSEPECTDRMARWIADKG